MKLAYQPIVLLNPLHIFHFVNPNALPFKYPKIFVKFKK